MSFQKWCLRAIFIIVVWIPALSEAFDLQLTQKQIEEATEYGKKYKGTAIFGSPMVKLACFGGYPHGEGGLIMSKYIKIAVTSAMKAMQEKPLTPGEIQEIGDATGFDVIVVISDENIQSPMDVQIVLQQGTNNILPYKTEFGMKHKDNKQSVIGTFQYEKINLKAKTTIVVKTKNRQQKYSIDLSDVK